MTDLKQQIQTPDLSDRACNFMAAYFALGPGSEIISHEPHASLAKQRAAYDECLSAGLVREEAYNAHGSKRITATERGLEVARSAFLSALRGSHV